MVRLIDIAKKCGISVAQVSRALNDHDDVSEKTKQKVKKVASDMGYVKNLNASLLAGKKSNQIALIIHGIDNDNNIEATNIFNIMKGVNRFAKENGLVSVVHLTEDPNISYLNYCKERGIAGVILFGANYDDDNFKEIVQSDFPCVVIDIPIEGPKKGCVIINNLHYSLIAVKELIKRDRKRIAMLMGHGHAMVDIERRMGYEMALGQSRIPIDEDIIVKAKFDLNEAYKQTKILLDKHKDLDAFFCTNDFMALGAMDAIKEYGYKIPEDIAVFGFDGIILGNYSKPTLSTIKQDNLKKGYQAAKILYKILNDEEYENMASVPCEVVIKDSI